MTLADNIDAFATTFAAWIGSSALIAGAALTLLGGLVGSIWQSRRDHERWIRERRYEAYVAMVRTLNRWILDEKAGDPDTIRKAHDTLTEQNAAFFILGPGFVERAGAQVSAAVAAGNVAAAREALPEFEKAARQALAVKDYDGEPVAERSS
ncbi:hypothetical protein [Agromyces bauzanensis]